MTAVNAASALLPDGERASSLVTQAAELPLYADPGCEPQRMLDQVQSWAAQLLVRVAPDASPFARLRLLNHQTRTPPAGGALRRLHDLSCAA
jgi:hypothetical protein